MNGLSHSIWTPVVNGLPVQIYGGIWTPFEVFGPPLKLAYKVLVGQLAVFLGQLTVCESVN